MKTRKFDLEIRVGVFVFLGILVLATVIFSIRDFHIFREGYHIKILFNYAGGIKVGAPVRVAGVDVGAIKDIRILNRQDTKEAAVALTAWINRDVIIRADSLANINTLGILGEKYLEITPGSVTARILKASEILIGKDPVSLSRIFSTTYNMAIKMDKAISALNQFLKEPGLEDRTESILSNSEELISNLNVLTLNANILLDNINQGKGTIGRLIIDDSIYNDIEALVEDIKNHPWKLMYRPRRRR